jgi:DNA-binding transcriptional LysR family regulator
MHPGHPLAQHSSLHVQDLENQLLLTLNSDDNIYLQLQRTMLEHDVRPSSTVETTYSSTICCLAAQGTGLGVVNPTWRQHLRQASASNRSCPSAQ